MAFAELALERTGQLPHYIDAENSVLLPESELRLRRQSVRELPSGAPTPAEAAARAEGEDLVLASPPVPEPDLMRGDGCVMCPAFTRSCRGMEREWWNDWEWEEFVAASDPHAPTQRLTARAEPA